MPFLQQAVYVQKTISSAITADVSDSRMSVTESVIVSILAKMKRRAVSLRCIRQSNVCDGGCGCIYTCEDERKCGKSTVYPTVECL